MRGRRAPAWWPLRTIEEFGINFQLDEITGNAAVGVCLLWSIANPAHEDKVGELLARHLPGVAVTLSHRLNPIVR